MDWAKLRSRCTWQNLKDLAVETAWKASTTQGASGTLSYPIDPKRLETVRILWPAEYEWPPAKQWADHIFNGLQHLVKTEIADIRQPFPGVIIFHLAIGENLHEIALDYGDYSPVNEECARQCSLYFKMQYLRQGYSWQHVLPGGFIPGDSSIYSFFPHLRNIRDKREFTYDVYGRFGQQFAIDIRRRAVQLLSEQKRFWYEGGLTKIRYSRFLREVARSKICIDLPGNGDFCFRLIDYLAVGACIISFPHRTALHSPLVDRTHIVYAKEDLSDIVDLCAFYLENEEEREEICRNSREFFDAHLQRSQLAAYYLRCCLERLS